MSSLDLYMYIDYVPAIGKFWYKYEHEMVLYMEWGPLKT